MFPQTSKVAMLREIRPPQERPFVIEEVKIPPLTDGAVLVKMVCAGVCGTDVHILHGKVPVKVPAILGHENVGTVTDIGGKQQLHDITGKPVNVGDLITWLPKSCMHCFNCTILGDQAKCEQRLGYGGWVPAWEHPYLVGGLAEYAWLLPDSDIVVLPPDMRPEAVVLGDALRIMVHGLDRIGGLDYGDTVLVQGSGAVGLMGLLLAKHAGADKVIIIGAPVGRLNLAREFGAFATLDVTQTSVAERAERVMEMTGGRGADVVLECAGVPAAVAEGLNLVRINGRYVIAGHYGDAGTVPINPHIINKKQITVTGAWSAANKHFLRALKLLQKLSDEEVDKLVTHRFTLAQTNDALIAAERQETLKAVITPGVGL